MTDKKDLEQITQENIIRRQINKVVYAKRTLDYDERIIGEVENKVVVPEHSYATVSNPRDPETGEIRHGEKEVRPGPVSFALYHGEVLRNVKEDIEVPERHYATVHNPRDSGTGEIQHGKVEVRIGPTKFPLYHGEVLEGIDEETVVPERHFAIIRNPRDPNTGEIQQGRVEVRRGKTSFPLFHGEKLEGITDEVVVPKHHYATIKNPIDPETGEIQQGRWETRQGPASFPLFHGERLEGIDPEVIVPEHHYARIKNPVDPGTGEIQHGDVEIRIGPRRFPLFHGEELEGIEKEFILTKYDGLLLKAKKDFGEHKAGYGYLITGPATYIPSKHEQVIRQVKGIPLSDTDGLYVQNKTTGDVNLITGEEEEQIFFFKSDEQPYRKELTDDELAGLGLVPQTSRDGVRILTRQAANASHLEDKSRALVLELEENEVVHIYDGTDTRIEKGPKTTFLGPYERPKVLNLSGGRPIQQGALKVALLKLGPDFIYDRVTARTKDNAQLDVDVTYKWRFNLDDADLKKAFSIEDFVGYTAETLSSEIRSTAAQHDFEEFHANALQYVKDAVFGEGQGSRTFEENGLEIFGIDVTAITPSDKRIADKLHDAIKKNMQIYCDKLVLTATLESERQEVEGKSSIASEREKLIQAEAKNKRLQTLEAATIRAEEQRIQAESEAASRRVKAESEAEATRIHTEAEIESEKQKLEVVISQLNQDGGDKYLELQKAQAFEGSEKLVVVPTESKIVLPFARGGEYDDE
jgi:regulator of protease activity HflC (stomatin/prohibitin superfamily)